jgi:hypothetical protein
MDCLVEMPESAGVATTKVRNMLQQRMQGKMPAPAAPTAASLRPSPEDQALKSQAKGILREEKAAKPPREKSNEPKTGRLLSPAEALAKPKQPQPLQL